MITSQFGGGDTIEILSNNKLIEKMNHFKFIACRVLNYNGFGQSPASTKLNDPLKYIQFTSFPSLLELNLKNSEILTIESIGSLDIPKIRKLDLSNNRITEISPLSNLIAGNINHINSDENNSLFTIDALTEGDWPQL